MKHLKYIFYILPGRNQASVSWKKPRIYLDSFCKAHLITETSHIFLGKVKK